MPYELRKQDGGYKVGKQGSKKTFSKKSMSKEKAKAQLAALHINAPKESTMKTKEQMLREYIRKEIKKALSEEKADKDYDKDGEVESPEAEFKGSRDKAIKKAMKKND